MVDLTSLVPAAVKDLSGVDYLCHTGSFKYTREIIFDEIHLRMTHIVALPALKASADVPGCKPGVNNHHIPVSAVRHERSLRSLKRPVLSAKNPGKSQLQSPNLGSFLKTCIVKWIVPTAL